MFYISRYVRRLVSIGIVLSNMLFVIAQENQEESDWAVGGDFVSRFYWRGMSLTTSSAIQPHIEYSKDPFALGVWGSYTFAKEPYQEIDTYFSFKLERMSLTVYDYFVVSDSTGVSHQYFDWKNRTTAHSVELVLEAWGVLNTDLSIEAGVFVYGADKDANGLNNYSTYIESQYSFEAGDNELKAFAGFSPFNGMYAGKMAFVNVGISITRELKLSKTFVLPFNALLAVNPDTESVFMIAGFSF